MPTVRTPEAPCRRSPSRDPRCCLPLWEMGSATPSTIDFGAIFPFTCVPAYSFPVYASQRPLPDATQDSVRGCWLGFAAVAISGACASRAFKAQPPQIRTCGFCRIRLLDRWLRYARRRVPAGPAGHEESQRHPHAALASSAIRCRFVETGSNLGVLAICPSNGSICRRPLPSTGSRWPDSPTSPVLWGAPIPRRPSPRASLPSRGGTIRAPAVRSVERQVPRPRPRAW